jgi:translation initiation factor IF-1
MAGKTSKDRPIILEGVVREALKNFFKVEIFPDGREPDRFASKVHVLAYPSGRLRCNKIKVVPGDRVTVAVSKHDYTKGRITYRSKD